MMPGRIAIAVVASVSLAACAGLNQRGDAPVGGAIGGAVIGHEAGGQSSLHETVAPREAGSGAAQRAAAYAVRMVGVPYRHGGASPSTGFDCSGLVQFSYRQAGVSIPRTTAQQRRASRLIRVSNLRRGDLLFFHQAGKGNSHVAMYIGDGYFVHAPSSGKHVRTDRLDSPYWRRHLSEVRRIDV